MMLALTVLALALAVFFGVAYFDARDERDRLRMENEFLRLENQSMRTVVDTAEALRDVVEVELSRVKSRQ